MHHRRVRTGSQGVVAIALVLLAIAAWLGGPGNWRDAAEPVSAALVGAALSQAASWYAFRLQDAARNEELEATRSAAVLADLDETRRLLQMLRLSLFTGPPSAELAATVWNALTHHSDVVTPQEASSLVHAAVTGYAARKAELINQAGTMIDRITARELSLKFEQGRRTARKQPLSTPP
jgi:hypothetical protein